MQYRSAFDALTIYVHTHERAALPGHAPRLTHRPPAQINTPWKLHVTQIGNCTLGQKCDTQTSFNGDQGAVGIVWAAVLLTPCQAISSLVRKSTQLPDGFSHFPSQPLQS